MNHDPLCPDAHMDWVLCHRCTLIARVRADERENVARDIERIARQFDRDAMAVLVGARVARRDLP